MKYQIYFITLTLLFSVHGESKNDSNLFSSNDFSQWNKVNGDPVGVGWTIKKGVVHRNARGGDIITKEKFKDFELTFGWKISEAGNSGIKYRTRGGLGLEYQVRGNQIEHWLNGEKVVEITWGTDDWKDRFQKSKYRKNDGFGSWEGPILLQDHNDPAWFRNLKIKRL